MTADRRGGDGDSDGATSSHASRAASEGMRGGGYELLDERFRAAPGRYELEDWTLTILLRRRP